MIDVHNDTDHDLKPLANEIAYWITIIEEVHFWEEDGSDKLFFYIGTTQELHTKGSLQPEWKDLYEKAPKLYSRALGKELRWRTLQLQRH